jgi:hypothetical protein
MRGSKSVQVGGFRSRQDHAASVSGLSSGVLDPLTSYFADRNFPVPSGRFLLLPVRFAPNSDQSADIGEGPSRARGLNRSR